MGMEASQSDLRASPCPPALREDCEEGSSLNSFEEGQGKNGKEAVLCHLKGEQIYQHRSTTLKALARRGAYIHCHRTGCPYAFPLNNLCLFVKICTPLLSFGLPFEASLPSKETSFNLSPSSTGGRRAPLFGERLLRPAAAMAAGSCKTAVTAEPDGREETPGCVCQST